jgi:hypothetical protein
MSHFVTPQGLLLAYTNTLFRPQVITSNVFVVRAKGRNQCFFSEV